MNSTVKKDVFNNCPDNVHIFSRTRPDIGYVARTITQGQEYEMVRDYLKHLISQYSRLKHKKAAIFVEPQLDTGYPDIVIVEYFSLPTDEWRNARSYLNNIDLKILFYIQSKRGESIAQISDTLGYPIFSVENSVKKLSDSGLLHLSKSKKFVRNVQLKSYCRIHKIIAIEAKVDKWKEAVRQANNNIWFATESYILMNKESCSPSITELCKSNGIGIILINGKIKTTLASVQRPFPVSYASLQFNEWILRDVNMRREHNDHS